MKERNRLEALYSYDVLETERDSAYDDITMLASQICDTPIALINFVDVNRVWVKSGQGLSMKECPRESAFCAHTILQDTPLIIQDVQQDERFRHVEKYAFYAGVPLKTPDGHNIGTICVLDYAKKTLSGAQIRSLEALARQVVTQLELSKSLLLVREKKSAYQSLIENLKEIVFSTDAQGQWNFLSPSWSEILGFRLEDCLGRPFIEFIHPEDREESLAKFFPLMNKEKKFCEHQVRYKTADGSYRWVEIFARLTTNEDGTILGTTGTVSDIHEQKLAQEKLNEEKQKLDLITNNIGDVVWMTDPSKNSMIYISPSYERVWERTCKELYQTPFTFIEAIHEQDRERVLNSLQNQQKGTYNETYRILTPCGKIKWIHDKAFPVKNDAGEVYRVVGIASDISERIENEVKLNHEKEKFRTIVNNVPIFLTIFDENGFQWINPAFEKSIGWSNEEAQKRNLMEDLVPDPEKRQAVYDYMAKPQTDFWECFETFRKDGTTFPASWMNVKLSSGLCIGIGLDMSLQKQNEKVIEEQRAKILSAAKMSSLGEMAAGVAHEINNPLTIIMGRVQMMRQFAKMGEISPNELVEFCDKIDNTVGRITRIIHGLKTFARDGSQDPFEPVEIKKLIQETLSFCEARFKNNDVKLIVDEIPEVIVDCRYVQLSQVILNLLNNAFDAIVENDYRWVRLSIEDFEETIVFKVQDSGNGIPKAIQDKIMQPFFSTKEVGKGTGLGLSLSKGLIESHNGSLTLDLSAKNTTFVITLPKSQKTKLLKAS